MLFFVLEEPSFACQASAVATECATLVDDAMAGDDDGKLVGTVGIGDGSDFVFVVA